MAEVDSFGIDRDIILEFYANTREQLPLYGKDKTLKSVHFGVVVVEPINYKCGGIVRNEIW